MKRVFIFISEAQPVLFKDSAKLRLSEITGKILFTFTSVSNLSMPGGMQSKRGRNEFYMQHKRMSTQCHYATAAYLSRSKTSDWECPRFQHNQTRQRQKDGIFCGQKRPTDLIQKYFTPF